MKKEKTSAQSVEVDPTLLMQHLLEKKLPVLMTVDLDNDFEANFTLLQAIVQAVNLARVNQEIKAFPRLIIRAPYLKHEENLRKFCNFVGKILASLEMMGECLRVLHRRIEDTDLLNVVITSHPRPPAGEDGGAIK